MENTTTQTLQPNSAGKVVHRLPGRMRVRIDRLRDDTTYRNDLQQAVNGLRGVIEVRVNPSASSIIITYRPIELLEQTVLDCLGVSLPAIGVDLKIEHPESEAQSDADFVREAEKLTAEITSETIGESIGEIVGETVGELLMGPIGMAIGAELGAKLGEEIRVAIEHIIEESIHPESESTKDLQSKNLPSNRPNQKNNRRGK